ncbi:unnamed protein product, partial [Ectocarpus sp. 13 AM-2016]
ATAASGFEASYDDHAEPSALPCSPWDRAVARSDTVPPQQPPPRASALPTNARDGLTASRSAPEVPWGPLRPRCALRGSERPWGRHRRTTYRRVWRRYLPMNTRDGLTSSRSAPVGAAGAASASSCPPRDRPVVGAVQSGNGHHVGGGRRRQ